MIKLDDMANSVLVLGVKVSIRAKHKGHGEKCPDLAFKSLLYPLFP